MSREEQLSLFKPTEPPNNDQKAFLYSDADVRCVFGGNRSGKTHVGAADGLLFTLGIHPVRSIKRKPPVFGRVCAPKYEDGCKGVILKKFRSMIPHHELSGSSWTKAWSEKSKILSFTNGSTINFKSGEMDLNTYGGDDLDWFWEDEHIQHKYFIENMARIVDRDGWGIKTMTPEAGQTWEEDFVLNPPPGVTVEHWFFDTERNPYLSREGIKKLESAITDPKLREAKLHGRFVALSGLLYPMFQPDKVIIPDFEIPKHWERHILIDPHLRKFTAIMWTAWNGDGDVFVYRTEKVKKTVSELVRHIRTKSINDGKFDLYVGDEAMGGEGLNIFGERSVLEQLNELGLPFIPTSQASDKAFEAGVMKVQEYISPDPMSGKYKLHIFESCNTPIEYIDGKLTGSIFWEFKRYRFKREQKSDEETFREKVATVDDDYLDLLRYDVMAGAVNVGGEVQIVSSGEKDPITGW